MFGEISWMTCAHRLFGNNRKTKNSRQNSSLTTSDVTPQQFLSRFKETTLVMRVLPIPHAIFTEPTSKIHETVSVTGMSSVACTVT